MSYLPLTSLMENDDNATTPTTITATAGIMYLTLIFNVYLIWRCYLILMFDKHALRICTITGIILLVYLLYMHYGEGAPNICKIAKGMDCEVANKSKYAEFFGISVPIIGKTPVSGIGIAYFVSVILLSKNAKYMPHIFLISVVAVPLALYLSYVQYFVLQSVCLFCEISKIMIGIITFVSLHQSKKLGLLKIEM